MVFLAVIGTVMVEDWLNKRPHRDLHNAAMRQKLTDLVAVMQVGDSPVPDQNIIAVYKQCLTARSVVRPQLISMLDVEGQKMSPVQSNTLCQAAVQLDSMPTAPDQQIEVLVKHVNTARELVTSAAATF